MAVCQMKVAKLFESESAKKKRFSTNLVITFCQKKTLLFRLFLHRFSTKTQQLKDNAKPTRNDSQKINFSIDYHRFANSLL